MADRKQVGIRYCGGCNPRYDRVAVVERIKCFLPEADFVSAQSGTAYPAVLVVCGCASRCADISGLLVLVGGLIAVNGFGDLLPARETLERALQDREERTLNHEQVLDVLPHRPPMLFTATVSRLVPGVEVMASFCVEPDLPVFAGHFPGRPILPGVYAVEAAAQAADILMMTTQRYAGMLPLFAEIRQARFRRKILPGNVMDIHASLIRERAEVGMVTCLGQILVQEELAADVEHEAPLIKLAPPKIGEVEKAIGENCASLVPNGATLQLGIGAIPDAVLLFLEGKKNLGIHSEMFSDGVVKLAEAGVITNAKKSLHPGKFVVAQNDNLVSINSCVQVDLYGQAASESIGPKQISGVGGQVDFIRGASASKGGISILAMPSTVKGKISKIVPLLDEGADVTTSRNDVDYIVTEYGIAHLKGETLRQRARNLIEIAHPDFQDELKAEFEKRFHCAY